MLTELDRAHESSASTDLFSNPPDLRAWRENVKGSGLESPPTVPLLSPATGSGKTFIAVDRAARQCYFRDRLISKTT